MLVCISVLCVCYITNDGAMTEFLLRINNICVLLQEKTVQDQESKRMAPLRFDTWSFYYISCDAQILVSIEKKELNFNTSLCEPVIKVRYPKNKKKIILSEKDWWEERG